MFDTDASLIVAQTWVSAFIYLSILQETKVTTWQKPGTAPAKDSAGNVYDDESEQDDGPDFSSAMKQKMINEAGGLGADPNNSMVKVPLWQGPSSPPTPPQGAPGGSGQLGTPRKRPPYWVPPHCLGCSS